MGQIKKNFLITVLTMHYFNEFKMSFTDGKEKSRPMQIDVFTFVFSLQKT